MDWSWLQGLFGGGGGGAPSTSVIDPLDVPLDQMAQAKIAGGSPYEQDRLAQITQGLAQAPGGMDKFAKRLGGMGEKMVLNGLGQQPPQQVIPRPPMPSGAQLRGGGGPVVGTGAGLQPGNPEQRAREEAQKRQGRYMFMPSLY